MPRETKEFITVPSGIKIVIKSYITAREANSVKEEMLKAMKLGLKDGEPETTGEIPGSFVLDQERKLLGLLVVSINGISDGIDNALLEMRNEDYQSIVKEVNKIYQGNFSKGN